VASDSDMLDDSAGGSPSASPFEALGLPARIDLDPDAVDRAWRRAAAAWHPDRFADPLARAEAVRRAAVVNAARETLRDPLTRAEALSAVRGVALAGTEAAMPPAFLMQMLELRESLAEGAAGGDPAVCGQLAAEAEAGIEERLAAVASLLGQPAIGEAAAAIREHLAACRYLRRFAAEARAAAVG
jgi:molecular chaperone HscB